MTLGRIDFKGLLSNHWNKERKASPNDLIRSSISSAITYGVLPSAFAISIVFMLKNRSAQKITNKIGLNTELCGTPNIIYIQVLRVFSIFILCFLFDK